jgi:hypothetical protein
VEVCALSALCALWVEVCALSALWVDFGVFMPVSGDCRRADSRKGTQRTQEIWTKSAAEEAAGKCLL